MGKRTRGKRGAPFGNRNRLCHGRYARTNIARRREIRALIAGARAAMARAAMVTRIRRALLRRHARFLPMAPSAPPASRAAGENFSKTALQRQHRLAHHQRGRPP